MLALVSDTETNGKAKKGFNIDYTDLEAWPRITQFSWIVIDVRTGYIYSRHNHIIKPDNWVVPTVAELMAAGEDKPHFFEENNISTERCEKEGVPLPVVLDFFLTDLSLCKIYINHNLKFDYNVTLAEMVRYDKYPLKEVKFKICTMMTAKDILKLPGRFGDYKYPSLQELHKYLFLVEFDGNHDALSDVIATANCFIELVKRGHFKI